MLSPGKPFVAPTQRQTDYARLCGIIVRPDMDRDAVSRAIDAALAADPKLKFKIAARRKKEEKESQERWEMLPAKVKRDFKKWEDASEEHDHFLIAYSTGKNVTVDILECDDVRLDPTNNDICIDFLIPRIDDVVVGYDGKREVREKELRWDQKISLPISAVVESRKIAISEDQVKKYHSTIKRKIEQLKK